MTVTWKPHVSSRGSTYWLAEEIKMPRIRDEFLDCVIYLYKSEADAKNGKSKGGTGCLVGIPSERHANHNFLYAVANRHVVKNGSLWIRMNTQVGETDTLPTKIEDWHYTDDQDIAVCLVRPSADHKFKCLPRECFLTRAIVQRENVGPGDDVFLVGRFMNHEGAQCNTPTVRFGNLSMMPWEPVGHKSNQPPFQESFLADVRAVAGYSGAPVFVCARAFDSSGGSVRMVARGNDSWLLGIEWGYLDRDNPEWDFPGGGLKENSGMTGVVPAWRLLELLEHPGVVNVRKDLDDWAEQEIARMNTKIQVSPF